MQDLWFCVTPAALRAGCAALSVATLELPLIWGIFLILASESPSGREVNVSELFVCM